MVRAGRLAAVLLLALGLAGVALAPAAAAQGASSTYSNPVSRDFADTFADPAVIKAKDGYWYAYGTTDPLREGEGTRHIIPTARSTDLVN
jgi:arabinan endo-1,5-alpha-L-arabinosidase